MDEYAALETLSTFPDRHPQFKALFLFDSPGRWVRLDDRESLVTIAGLQAFDRRIRRRALDEITAIGVDAGGYIIE